jgi:hypothetical protein
MWSGWCLVALTAAGARAATFASWVGSRPDAPPFDAPGERYTPADALFGQIERAAAQHPGVVTAEAIGHSVSGRPIWAFHVVDPGVKPDRSLVVVANLHALEWIGAEVATALLLEAIALPPRGVALTVVPIANPDGRARSEADLRAGNNLYRRANDRGADLNRDWAVHRDAVAVWRHLLPRRFAATERPLSQPETRALDALFARNRYDYAVSLHAFGGFFYHPWSGAWERPADWAAFVREGRAMETAQGGQAYRTRELSRWGFFFRAQGSEIDHLYGTYGTHSWLIELTRSGLSFAKPGEWRTYLRWYNPQDPAAHVARGMAALHALLLAPPVFLRTDPSQRHSPH